MRGKTLVLKVRHSQDDLVVMIFDIRYRKKIKKLVSIANVLDVAINNNFLKSFLFNVSCDEMRNTHDTLLLPTNVQ